ncbi:hypothetical protein BHE74_00004164 [Ensete ventricosum]|nr:hypothetical protein BHE74_00004164 [Ensete ventricosum]
MENSIIRAVRELDYSRAHFRLREPNKLEDKIESTNREERDINARRRVRLVKKGTEKVENTETNSKYRDKAEGQSREVLRMFKDASKKIKDNSCQILTNDDQYYR